MGFAPLPVPGDIVAASRKIANTIITKTLNAMGISACLERNFREQIIRERTLNFSSHGNSAMKSAAIARPDYQ